MVKRSHLGCLSKALKMITTIFCIYTCTGSAYSEALDVNISELSGSDLIALIAEAQSNFPASLKQDELFFDRSVSELSVAYNNFYQNEFTVLERASLESVSHAQGMSLKDYFAKSAAYKAAAAFVAEKVSALETFSMAFSHNNARVLVDVSRITNIYKSKLLNLEKRSAQMSFNLLLPTGSLHNQIGLDASVLQKMNLFTADQLIAMREKAAILKIMRTSDRRRINQTLNQFTISKIQAYIRAYGLTQMSRWDDNKRQLAMARSELEEIMWVRSYIRAVFGLKIGSYGLVGVKKVRFNLEVFGRTPIRFSNQSILDENMLMVQQDLAYSILAAQEGKSKDILAYSTPFFSRIASILTFFKGESKWAEINVQVLKLLVADIEEERILGQVGGLRQLRTHYKRRYYSNISDEYYYKKLAEAYLPSEDGDSEDDPESDVATIDAHSMRGILGAAITSLKNQEDRISQARAIEATLNQLTNDSKIKNHRRIRQYI